MPPRISIVLVATRNPLNIGAVARAMANFGFEDLRLVNPWPVAFQEAVSAVGAGHILKAAGVFERIADAVSDCSLVLGTTAAQHRVLQQPLERLPQAAPRILSHSGRTALLFGSEKFGLSNDDMSFCHALIRIPTSPETPSMNLGQAVAVCLYELVREARVVHRPSGIDLIQGAEAEQLTRMLLDVLNSSGYTNRIAATSTEQKIRRWIRRTHLSRRDAPLMMGILRQILWKLRKTGNH